MHKEFMDSKGLRFTDVFLRAFFFYDLFRPRPKKPGNMDGGSIRMNGNVCHISILFNSVYPHWDVHRSEVQDKARTREGMVCIKETARKD